MPSLNLLNQDNLDFALSRTVFDKIFRALLVELKIHESENTILNALQAKHEIFVEIFSFKSLQSLQPDVLMAFIEALFSRSDLLYSLLSRKKNIDLIQSVITLVHESGEPKLKLQSFVEDFNLEILDEQDVIWDMGAELLHFIFPQKIPLMSRWVWDVDKGNGAIPELAIDRNQLMQSSLCGSVAGFEGVRYWLAEQLGQQGMFQDIHFLIDLLLARLYLQPALKRDAPREHMITRLLGIPLLDAHAGQKRLVVH